MIEHQLLRMERVDLELAGGLGTVDDVRVITCVADRVAIDAAVPDPPDLWCNGSRVMSTCGTARSASPNSSSRTEVACFEYSAKLSPPSSDGDTPSGYGTPSARAHRSLTGPIRSRRTIGRSA